MRISILLTLLLLLGFGSYGQNRCAYDYNKYRTFSYHGPNTEEGLWVDGCSIQFELDLLEEESPCSPAIAWYWDFGDGNSSNEEAPLHTYGIGGMKTVMLKQLFADGGIYERIFHVGVRGCGKECFAAIGLGPFATPCLTTFYGSPSTDGLNLNSATGLTSTFFDFGDGTGQLETQHLSLSQVSHTYAKPGIYDVNMIITTESGCVDTVLFRYPLGCSFDSELCTDMPFSNFEINGFCEFRHRGISYFDRGDCSFVFGTQYTLPEEGFEDIWDFGDGTSFIGKNPTHIYERPGTYTVSLMYKLPNGRYGKDSLKLKVNTCNPSYFADFAGQETEDCIYKFSSLILTPGDKVSQYRWDFGDGNVSLEKDPIHQFYRNGRYLVSLLLSTENGFKDTIRHEIVAQGCEGICTASFEHEKDSLDSNTYHFSSNGGTMVNQWTWDFGDGNTSNESNPTHTYANPGAYVVRSNVQGDGCEDIYVKIVFIATPLGEELLNGAINAFPNPSTGSFTVSAEFKKNVSVELNVIDMNGRQAIPNIIMEPGFGFRKEVNISSLPAGVYLLQLQTKEGLLHRQRIFKY